MTITITLISADNYNYIYWDYNFIYIKLYEALIQIVTTKQSKMYVMLTLVAYALIQENFNKFLDLHIFSWVKIFSNCWEEYLSTICSRHDAMAHCV